MVKSNMSINSQEPNSKIMYTCPVQYPLQNKRIQKMVWKNNQEPFIPIVQAVSVGGPMSSGRNQPLKMFCKTEDGIGDYIVKLWNTPELGLGVHSLAREIYGALLANFFGLNTPDVVFVDIDANFSLGIPNSTIRERIRQSPGLNFGSKYLSDVAIFNPPVTPAKLHEAAKIFCFDMLTWNVDRNFWKPNMFDTSNGFVLFDHEQAFPYSKPQMMLGGFPSPWDFIREAWCKNHILYSSLKGQDCGLEIEEFVGILETLDDTIFATIEEKVPTEWNTPELTEISTCLANARNHLELFKRSLQEILV
jgi:hypothetical protein